jgi:hypothetical protein
MLLQPVPTTLLPLDRERRCARASSSSVDAEPVVALGHPVQGGTQRQATARNGRHSPRMTRASSLALDAGRFESPIVDQRERRAGWAGSWSAVRIAWPECLSLRTLSGRVHTISLCPSARELWTLWTLGRLLRPSTRCGHNAICFIHLTARPHWGPFEKNGEWQRDYHRKTRRDRARRWALLGGDPINGN